MRLLLQKERAALHSAMDGDGMQQYRTTNDASLSAASLMNHCGSFRKLIHYEIG
jgi:hypothetical protein